MSIADATLGPIVWGVPKWSIASIGSLKRRVYCSIHSSKIRTFFFGMLAADRQMSPEDKQGYYEWLQELPWHTFLESTRERSGWLKNVNEKPNPISISLKEDYNRLFSCYQRGRSPKDRSII